MPIILSDEELNSLKKESATDKLIMAFIEHQKNQDSVARGMMEALNESLDKLKSLKEESINSDAATRAIADAQNKIAQAVIIAHDRMIQIKTSLDAFETLANKITSRIDSEGIIQSLAEINNKLTPTERQWQFDIVRDEYGRMKEIIANNKPKLK